MAKKILSAIIVCALVCAFAFSASAKVVWTLPELSVELFEALNSGDDSGAQGLQPAGASPNPFFTWSGGINVSGRGSDGWRSLDVLVGFVEAGKEYKMTVTGNAGGDKFLVHFPLDGSDGWDSENVYGDNDGVVYFFNSETWKDGNANPSLDDNGFRIRVRTDGTADYTIANIVIEEVGSAAPAAPVAGSTTASAGDDKGVDAGVGDVAVASAIALIAAGAVIFAKKRK